MQKSTKAENCGMTRWLPELLDEQPPAALDALGGWRGGV